jgi:hypothetical protein
MQLFVETVENGVRVHRLTATGLLYRAWQRAAVECLEDGREYSAINL